jgi:predicted nucleic acid-binding protein
MIAGADTPPNNKGFRVTGTLGVLDLAATRGLVDFAAAIRMLEGTSFRRPEAVLKTLLAKHKESDLQRQVL